MNRQGPKYFLNIEGTEHEWDSGTITATEIATLGGWDPSIGVIEIDRENNQRTLQPDETVELKPGQGFSRKIRWQRGRDLYTERIDAELDRADHANLGSAEEHGGNLAVTLLDQYRECHERTS